MPNGYYTGNKTAGYGNMMRARAMRMRNRLPAAPRPSGPVMGPGSRAPKKPSMLGSMGLSELKKNAGFGAIRRGKRPY